MKFQYIFVILQVNLIEEYNRFILVMDKTRANEIIPNSEMIRK